MLVDRVGDVLLVIHSTIPPDNEEWEGLFAIHHDLGRTPDGANLVLVHSDGGGPDARQRKRIAEVAARNRIALLTRSPVVRAIGTAVRWFNPDLRVLSPDDLEGARVHLDVAPERWRRVARRLGELVELLRDKRRSTGT